MRPTIRIVAHDIWKDNKKLMLNGCHDCWSYKAIEFAFEAKLIDFNPDINIFSMQTFSEVCSILFDEDHFKEYINTILIGQEIYDKNNYRKHAHMYLSKAYFITYQDSDWEHGS